MIISQNLESFLIKEILREGNFLWALASEWAADFLIVTAQNGQKIGILAWGSDRRAVKKA